LLKYLISFRLFWQFTKMQEMIFAEAWEVKHEFQMVSVMISTSWHNLIKVSIQLLIYSFLKHFIYIIFIVCFRLLSNNSSDMSLRSTNVLDKSFARNILEGKNRERPLFRETSCRGTSRRVIHTLQDSQFTDIFKQ